MLSEDDAKWEFIAKYVNLTVYMIDIQRRRVGIISVYGLDTLSFSERRVGTADRPKQAIEAT